MSDRSSKLDTVLLVVPGPKLGAAPKLLLSTPVARIPTAARQLDASDVLRGLLAELSLNSLPPPPFLQMSNGCSLEVPVHLEAHLAAHNRNV